MRIFKFYSQGCIPCKTLSLVLDKLKKEVYNSSIEVVEIDIETASPLTLEVYNVTSVPTLAYLHGDGRIETLVGFNGEVKTKAWIDSLRGD